MYQDVATTCENTEVCTIFQKQIAVRFQLTLSVMTLILCVCANIFDGHWICRKGFTAAFMFLLIIHYTKFWKDAVAIFNSSNGNECCEIIGAGRGIYARSIINLVFYGQLFYFTASSIALIAMVVMTFIKRPILPCH